MIRAFLALALLLVLAPLSFANGYGSISVRARVVVPYQPVVQVQQVYAQPIIQQVYAQPIVRHVQQVQSYCAPLQVQQVQSYCAPVAIRQVQAYVQPVQFVQNYSQAVVGYQQFAVRHSSAVSVRAPFVRVRVGGNAHHQQRGGLFAGLRSRSRR